MMSLVRSFILMVLFATNGAAQTSPLDLLLQQQSQGLPFGTDMQSLEDIFSGQRYSVIDGTGEGFLLSAGVDLTRVIGSMFLTGSALRASKYRARARFGLNYVHGRWSQFHWLDLS